MKELITTQLIAGFQKDENMLKELMSVHVNGSTEYFVYSLKLELIQAFITSLQSKQSEERQNIVDAYRKGSNDGLIEDYLSPEDYFNQTFKQEQK